MHASAADRYQQIPYARCGRSGLQFPHFDLANNYGPPPGSAEENFGHILATDLAVCIAFSPLAQDSIDRHARDGGLNICAESSQSG
jgi:hypothetical protein